MSDAFLTVRIRVVEDPELWIARLEPSDEILARIDATCDRIERKLDRFIAEQLHWNHLVEQRVSALEQRRG